MDINAVENVISLLVSIIGLLTCLFRFIEVPRKGWLYLSLFYLSCLMSDFYWTTYLVVMGSNPDYGSAIASFGWNISCLFLYIIILTIRNPKTKGFFHPLILFPIPVLIGVYLSFTPADEGINSFVQCLAAGLTMVVTLRALIYWYKNRREGAHFPHLKVLILAYIIFQTGMWFCEVNSANGHSIDLYYYFVFLSFVPLLLFPGGMQKDILAEELEIPEKSSYEMRLQILLQALVSLIIVGGCAGGYFVTTSMKSSLPSGGDSGYTGTVIAVTLFTISVVMVLLILSVITVVAFRGRRKNINEQDPALGKRSRFNLIFTLLITLVFMLFTVAYNARLLFNASVERIYGSGQEKAKSTAAYLENYLSGLESSLWTTADTVNVLMRDGVSQEKIRFYLIEQTANQRLQFDRHFAGVYGIIRGEYMDGTGWIPPKSFDPRSRGWYKTAIKAGGKTAIVSPYIDAQTRSVIITICKLMNDAVNYTVDNRDVLALDVKVDHITSTMKEQNIGGKGYGMVVDSTGFIIAHQSPENNGKNIKDLYGLTIPESIMEEGGGKINTSIEGEQSTLFISTVMGQWYVIFVIKDSELFSDLQTQVLVNVIISLGIFLLISLFYYLSYKNEQVYNLRMEEMTINRQKQEYEAEVLRLEKVAADEANKAKGSFLADMSHEIRTPINAILGMNEMILREADDPGIREYARNIGASGKNLLALINSILDFSKIEDGKMEIVPVHYSVSEMITYLVNSISERARGKGLELIVNADPTLPSELYGDDTRINQVIMNLLTNAVKYTHEGSVTLTLKAGERQDDDITILVEVRDTGIGIKKSEMGKLFESFERLDVVRNRNIEGTGLGMSITTRLLKLMDSELKVQSKYGEGSVFSFEIKQKIVNDTPLGDYKMMSYEDEIRETYNEAFHAPDAHILIVDDTKMNIIVATGLLKSTGIKIDSAMNGQDAIALADKNVYDVIFLDQRMPGMDGTETLKLMKASAEGKNKDTPVICLTADAISGAKEKYIEIGFTDYLTKPVNGLSLEQILLKHLPKEKIETGSSYPALTEAGLDTDAGLQGFNGDREFYQSILAEYTFDYDERYAKLQEFYNKEDWDSYRTSIHALKSSSRTIGAHELSDLALELERASGERDLEVVHRDHPKAMELYETTVAAIRESVDVEKYASDDDWEEF